MSKDKLNIPNPGPIEASLKTPEGKRIRAKTPKTPPNTDLLTRRLLSCLERDSIHLLRQVRSQKLSRDEAQSLVNYLKFLKEYNKIQDAQAAELSTEELEKAAGEGKDEAK